MKPIYIPPLLSPYTMDAIEEELLALPWETKRTARHEYFMSDGKVCNVCGGRGRCDNGDPGAADPVCFACRGEKRVPVVYSYGRLDDGIIYRSKPWSPWVQEMAHQAGAACRSSGFVPESNKFFNACFLNKYDDQHQHLGWHADDFAGMDPAAPIAVMSFGAEREIWVKRQFKACETCGGTKKIPGGVLFGGQAIEELTCPTCEGSGDSEERVTGPVPPEDRYLLQRGSLFIMPPGFQEVMFHRIPKHPQPCGWRISLTFRRFLTP